MSYSTVGSPFGLDVEYFNDKTGQTGTANVGTGPNCGSATGMQWMLWSLGYYDGPIDGNVGPDTRAGLVAFGLSKGIFYDPQTTPNGQICQALMDDYAAWMATPPAQPPPGQCPDGQWGVPPYCLGEPTHPRPEGAGNCPEGTVGLPPYCVAMPGYTAQPPAPQATICPEGQVGYPPNCYGLPTGIPTVVPGLPTTVPGLPTQPPLPGLPKPGGPPPVPPVPPPTGQPPATQQAGWWGQRSQGEKVILVVGGGLVVVAVVAAVGGKKKAYTPNRRRGRKTRKSLRP